MARNGAGSYSLPESPFVAGTTISSAVMNSDLADIATALTGSLAADGQTSMTGPLKNPSGTVALPGISFGSEPGSGLWLSSSKKVGLVAGGATVLFFDGNAVGVDGNQLYLGNGAIINPVGVVQDFTGLTAPTGWAFPSGQNILRASYPELHALYSAASYPYGSGDGSTTFGVPDLRGRVTIGRDDMGGSTAGRITAAGSGITGTTLGAAGGAQTVTILQVNLPSYTLPDTLAAKVGGAANGLGVISGSSSDGVAGGAAFNCYRTTTYSTISVTGSVTSGGSGTATNVTQPGLVLNKILFLGRP